LEAIEGLQDVESALALSIGDEAEPSASSGPAI
jgi:hypothetical protein